jgi:predicted nucleic acid-binding protein
MILLDTNVVSALMRPQPELPVLEWLDSQPRSSIWISSITVMELRYGLQILPKGRRRDVMLQLLEKLLADKIEARIASFDAAAAQHTADLMASRRLTGRTGEYRDTMIAGIALATGAALATRNIAHFADLSVPVINPWTA